MAAFPKGDRLLALRQIARVIKPWGFIHFSEFSQEIEVEEVVKVIGELGFKIICLEVDPFAQKPGFSVMGQKGNRVM